MTDLGLVVGFAGHDTGVRGLTDAEMLEFGGFVATHAASAFPTIHWPSR